MIEGTRVRVQGRIEQLFRTNPHLARRQIASSIVPVAEAPLTYLSSSAVSALITRFCVFPFKFGNEPASTWVVIILVTSSTDQVPILAIMPVNTALFSSGVPWSTLLILKFAMSERAVRIEYRPLASKMSRPFGLGPRRSDFRPCLSVEMMET